MADHVAVAEIEVDASPDQVWAAMTDPAKIERYMFGSKVETDWKPGSRIAWKGEYDGKPYEDHGEILDVQPGRRLELTHCSPLGGAEDVPENYNTIVYELTGSGDGTHVRLTQDNNPSEEQAEQFSRNWQQMLTDLKEVVEQG
jgi:uncharacterized protein YndB with AHSA1/START domain